MLKPILESGLKFAIVDDGLSVRGSAALVAEFRQLIADWKPEVIKIVAGETVADVGNCDQCGSELLGLLTFDNYVNRVCPDCGQWFRCWEPSRLLNQNLKFESPQSEDQFESMMTD